jgi:hypothetical protein
MFNRNQNRINVWQSVFSDDVYIEPIPSEPIFSDDFPDKEEPEEPEEPNFIPPWSFNYELTDGMEPDFIPPWSLD